MDVLQRVYKRIEDNRQRILDKKINCIPSPLPSFSYDFPGIEKGKYYLISGGSKSSKSKITNFLFLFNAVLYAYAHPELVRLRVFYALLEETEDNIMMKFICYLLYKKYKERIDIKTLDSINASRMVSSEVIQLIHSPEMESILTFYKDHVFPVHDRNPTGIYNTLVDYANKSGTEHKKWSEWKKQNVFDWYEPNDPDEYVMCIVDHISLISTERGMDLRESISKLSEYLKIVRNKYSYIPVVVQQQNSETLSLEAFKANKIRPTQKGLANSQDTAKDCDLFLGITNPYSFEMREYLRYDITKLRGYARFLEVVFGRDGESNSVLGMYFDGATGFYAALPKYDNITELSKVYQLVQKNQESTSK